MRAYSPDLRERVAAACAQPERTLGQVAARFGVSTSFVDQLLRRQRTSGSLAALPHRGGPMPLLTAQGQGHLEACLRQQPDATLDEVRTLLAAVGGPALSRSAIWRAVQALDWRRKKKASTPPSATPSGS